MRMVKPRWQRVLSYVWVLVGTLGTALALDVFLVPNQIAAGGVSGLATITYHWFGWPVGMVMLAINIPLFLASLRTLGREFGVKTIVGTVSISLWTDLLAGRVQPLTEDPLLAAIYGGILAGVGMGVCFRAGGSTGGTDMAARMVAHYTRMSTGRALLLADGLVILLAALAFSPELALYALLAVFLTGKAIDFVQEGQGYAKAAYIISTRADEIGQAVLTELQRGATALRGKGLYTGEDREVLLVIVSRAEVAHLKGLVSEIDPRAFMVIHDVHEVLGEGFGPIQAAAGPGERRGRIRSGGEV
ncbi:YitT family protein [Limnochorda pilosa]|uniref:YitT family protein n=1 Tax=Limnochorda pilosa TaxID=1555112 RepID=UPI0026F175C3|nr:YitT family protein [Limnochorda pilosa]